MNTEEVKVWDLFIRIFHWSLVACFFIAYLTEDDVMWLHELAGYLILALVAARLIWGLIGPRYARFSDFIYKPATVLNYFKDSLQFKSKRYLGHNPLGGTMVIVLLVMLVLTSWSGIEAEREEGPGEASYSIELIKSAQADEDEDDEHEENNGNEFWEELHEFLANFTLLLIAIHIAGVLFSGFVHGENLVKTMFTGRKRKQE